MGYVLDDWQTMKQGLFLAVAVLLADSTSSTTVRLAGEFGERIEIDSVSEVSYRKNGSLDLVGALEIKRKGNKNGIEYPIGYWCIDGIKKRETK